MVEKDLRDCSTSFTETFLNEASGSRWHKALGLGIPPLPVEWDIQVTSAGERPGSTQSAEWFCAVGDESLGGPSHLMCLWLWQHFDKQRFLQLIHRRLSKAYETPVSWNLGLWPCQCVRGGSDAVASVDCFQVAPGLGPAWGGMLTFIGSSSLLTWAR